LTTKDTKTQYTHNFMSSTTVSILTAMKEIFS